MLRASAACELAGIPSASLVCEGFIGQAKATSLGLGLPGLPAAMVPGHPGVQSKEELRRNVMEVTLEHVIRNLTSAAASGDLDAEPEPGSIVCKGSWDEVNEYFLEKEWSDGLPIVPPTRARVNAFLAHAKRKEDEVISVMLPDNRAATVLSVAINGVMAGCRPEYMPVLLTLAEAMADPAYGVEHSGNTPGAETLIILNGPVIKDLKLNVLQGVMRDGFQSNTAIGRYWRLMLRNVAGFLPHKTDKGTFGNTWRVAIGENEEVLKKIGWPTLAEEMGAPAGASALTIARYTGGNLLASASGTTPEELLPYIADGLVRQHSWQHTFTMGVGYGTLRPLVLLTPILAETIAKAGWSKADVRNWLFEHARTPAWQVERILRDWNMRPIWNFYQAAQDGTIPKVFGESDDPNRLIPMVWKADDYMIAVTGDPLRTNAYVFAQNGQLGFPVTHVIK